jgi:hypothetical protein
MEGVPTDLSNFRSTIQYLSQYVELQDPFEEPAAYDASGLGFFQGDGTLLAWTLQTSNSTYQQRSVEERLTFVQMICLHVHPPFVPNIVRTIFYEGDLDLQICRAHDKRNWTLLHLAAYKLGQYLSLISRDVGLQEFSKLISDLVKGGSDLSAISLYGTTPLGEVIQGTLQPPMSKCLSSPRPSTLISECTKSLIIWLKQLKNSGVDLIRYGRDEKDILESSSAEKEFEYFWEAKGNRFYYLYIRWINFTYGPEPEDWTFWFAPVMEDYFTDFWDMVDHPERAMPGAWVEEYYINEREYYSGYRRRL